MNKLLWILQALLALHTATGALWKLSNSAEQTMPSLAAIPSPLWTSMSLLEILCALGLILPAFYRPLAILIPTSACIIAAEMLAFCALHITSGDSNLGPLIYWFVVADLCLFVAYGRFKLKPL